jgi:hypothetical protein
MAQIDRLISAVASTCMIRYLVVSFFVKRDRGILIFSSNKNKNLEKRCSRIGLGLRTVERLLHAVRGNGVLDLASSGSQSRERSVLHQMDRYCECIGSSLIYLNRIILY